MSIRLATGQYEQFRYTITLDDGQVRLNWDFTHLGKIENAQMWFASVDDAKLELHIAMRRYMDKLQAHKPLDNSQPTGYEV